MSLRPVKLLLGILVATQLAPPLMADISLLGVLINANGTQYEKETLVPGVNTAGWDKDQGLGTLRFTFNPGAPGTYSFDVFFDHALGVPFYNEFGTVNGAPATGQTYEIGDSFASNIYPDVQAGGALPNVNTLPGPDTNFLLDCPASNPQCKGDFSAAMGFTFALGAGEEGVITYHLSQTNPGGFSLQGTHLKDGATEAPVNLFIDGSVAIQPTGPTPVPEPSSLVLLSGVAAFLVAVVRRRGAHSGGRV